MPFGLEALPLHVMGWGIDGMLAVGHFVARLPGAVTVSPTFPMAALAVIVLGGLWLAIWRRRWRWLGLAPILLGVVLALTTRAPDLLVAADARTVAVRGRDGLLHFVRPPKDRYAAMRWLARDGDGRMPEDAVGGADCDGVGCVLHTPKGSIVAVSLRPESLSDDCALAAILVSAAPVGRCPGPRLVLDSSRIAQGGGYAVTFPARAISVRQARGNRPWSR